VVHELKLNSRLGEVSDPQKKSYAEKYQDLATLKQGNEERLEGEVDGMM